MSRICETCGLRVRAPVAPAHNVLRFEPSTGLTYKFCSEACAHQWDAGPHAKAARAFAPEIKDNP